MQTMEAQMEARDRRRGAAEHRFLSRLERREKQAEQMVGELTRDGETIYYINEQSQDGRLTGHTREFKDFGSAVSFLLRNHYA